METNNTEKNAINPHFIDVAPKGKVPYPFNISHLLFISVVEAKEEKVTGWWIFKNITPAEPASVVFHCVSYSINPSIAFETTEEAKNYAVYLRDILLNLK